MDYFDILLAKKLEDDRDPRVEGLSVTENGRYHEEGVVYDPVIVALPLDSKTITSNGTYKASDDNLEGYNEVDVNVPLPSNAYLLKDIEGTPSAIATFTDGSALPMPKLEVAIEPVQEGSGDPSPENIRPISGWSAVDVNVSGKNILPKGMNANNGFRSQYALLPDGTGNVDLGLDVSEFFKVPSSGKITLSGLTGYGRSYCFYDKDKNYISGDSYQNRTTITVTVPANAVFIRLTLVHRDSATQNTDEMVEIGSTATTYEPYNGSTITIQLGDTYYGGTLDVVSGVMTADWKAVNLNTLTWTYQSDYSRLYADVTNIIQGDGARTVEFINSDYRCLHNGEEVSQIHDGDTYTYGNTVFVHDSRYTDGTAFKNATTAKMVYPMATPLTIQLTPTAIKSLQGINNVCADTGDILDGQYFSKEE